MTDQLDLFGSVILPEPTNMVFRLKKGKQALEWNGYGRIPKFCLENTVEHVPSGKLVTPEGFSNYGWWRDNTDEQ